MVVVKHWKILFPAQAGVIPLMRGQRMKSISFPRTGGGDPVSFKAISRKYGFSPHRRG